MLSDGQFYRVGGTTAARERARDRRDAPESRIARAAGLFREDLYHRLNVIRLRRRRANAARIALLTRHFLKSARDLGVEPKRVSDEALAYLTSLAFPGNVRQLENLANWLTVMAPAQTVVDQDLPPDCQPARVAQRAMVRMRTAAVARRRSRNRQPVWQRWRPRPSGRRRTAVCRPVIRWEHGLRTEVARLLRENSADVMDELARRFEAAVIREALDFTRGRKVEAAERLGIGRNTITRKIQELHLVS